ncbi:energy transducer TonB [Paraburkholderia acidiphila]|uniref:TonB family protein n=1 Tax=Paraburkholderia acidiphila TaxID=2571747 RepID=A0A7Z2G2R5_9BURK|nr:energy transducer TonB [Paraburkholderia acidiphila]QGZ54166.1 TonB family protein [Paraburkholderia acidiphila]
MNKKRLLLSAFPLMLMLVLGACASDDVTQVGPHVRPSPQLVMTRCLAAVATPGFAPPTEASLDSWQWKRYVNCKLGGNMRINPRKVPLDAEAIVSIRAASDGSIVSVTLLRSSGNDDLDEAVERGIAAASPLPPVPRALHIARIDMHFHPIRVDPLALQPGQPGIDSAHSHEGSAGDSH